MYYTADKGTYTIIDEFTTKKEAQKAIRTYLKEDRELAKSGTTVYDEDFYVILDEEKNEVEIYTAAATLGRRGGHATTPAKKKAAADNLTIARASRVKGKTGGWPKGKPRKDNGKK